MSNSTMVIELLSKKGQRELEGVMSRNFTRVCNLYNTVVMFIDYVKYTGSLEGVQDMNMLADSVKTIPVLTEQLKFCVDDIVKNRKNLQDMVDSYNEAKSKRGKMSYSLQQDYIYTMNTIKFMDLLVEEYKVLQSDVELFNKALTDFVQSEK